jgi:hypothetical protein
LQSEAKIHKPEADAVVYIPKHTTPQKLKRTSIVSKPFTKFDLHQVPCSMPRLELEEESKGEPLRYSDWTPVP